MRLLVVDDNRQLAELTGELLRHADRRGREIGTISFAGDLESALRLLPNHDAVLCDGQFPVSPNFWYRRDQWMGVYAEAVPQGTLFVLYSGDAETVEHAQKIGIPAIAKPSRIETLYASLMNSWHEARHSATLSMANR